MGQFTIEFYRVRASDDAHATLDRLAVIAGDLSAAKIKAGSMFESLDMPQKPDGFRILDHRDDEVFRWKAGDPQ